jgi:ornithine carbamoyltransferase
MPQNLTGRSFLTLLDFTGEDLRFLLRLATSLKEAKAAGTEQQMLRGKVIALIFEKDSTRTRSAFEVAAFDQGAHVTYLGPTGSHIGTKETMKDTARVLGRFYDAIEYRGSAQSEVEVLARHAGVPVFNGLTAEFHPTQVLADLMTMREFTHKHLSDTVFCFVGDTGGNIEQHLVRLQRIGSQQKGPAVRQLDMGHLQFGTLAAQNRKILAPIELKGIAGVKV